MGKTPGPMPAAQKWHVETRMRADGILVTTMTGIADGPFAEEVEKQLRLNLRIGSSPVDWIPDASRITKTELSLMDPAKQVLKTFKERGGRHVVAVVTLPVVAMAARTISFGAGLMGAATIDAVVESLPDALAKIEQLRKRKESA